MEELFVVWTTLSQQLNGCGLGPLLLKAPGDRARLSDLVVEEGLLGLQEAPVLASQRCCTTDEALGHIVALAFAVWRVRRSVNLGFVVGGGTSHARGHVTNVGGIYA